MANREVRPTPTGVPFAAEMNASGYRAMYALSHPRGLALGRALTSSLPPSR